MMDSNSEVSLLSDLFRVLPAEIDFYIQAPSLDNEFILNMMIETEWDYYRLIRIHSLNRNYFIEYFNDNDVVQFFHSIQLKNHGKLLFEGYDGVLYDVISKEVIIPEWFRDKYVTTGDCILSQEW